MLLEKIKMVVDRELEWRALRQWVEEQTGGAENGLGGDIDSVERRKALSWTLGKHSLDSGKGTLE